MNIYHRLLPIEQSLDQSVIPVIESLESLTATSGKLAESQQAKEIAAVTADGLKNLANYHQLLLESIRSIRAEVQVTESQTATITAFSNALIGTLGGTK